MREQIITVFLGSFVGGTMMNQLQHWLQNPESALTILGTAAPLTAIFFTQYIMLQVGPWSLGTRTLELYIMLRWDPRPLEPKPRAVHRAPGGTLVPGNSCPQAVHHAPGGALFSPTLRQGMVSPRDRDLVPLNTDLGGVHHSPGGAWSPAKLKSRTGLG